MRRSDMTPQLTLVLSPALSHQQLLQEAPEPPSNPGSGSRRQLHTTTNAAWNCGTAHELLLWHGLQLMPTRRLCKPIPGGSSWQSGSQGLDWTTPLSELQFTCCGH